MLGVSGSDVAARRLPFGNLFNRAFGSALVLMALPLIGPWIVQVVPDNAHAVADFHLAYEDIFWVLY